MFKYISVALPKTISSLSQLKLCLTDTQTSRFALGAETLIARAVMKLTIIFTSSLIILALTQCVNALNILGIFPYQGKSHFFVFRVYLQELAKRGHNVTVISHFPTNDPVKNYHDISLAGSIKILEDDFPIERSYMTVLWTGLFLTTTGRENCKVMLANKQVQDLIKQSGKFDVVVVEQFNSDCALGIAYKLRAPVVGVTSHVLMPWHYERLGIPYNPSYVSFHFLEGGTKPTLYQRLERVVFNAYFKWLYYYVSQRSNQNTLAQYFDDIPPLEDLAREIKFLLLYHNFVLTGSKLFPANVIEVGGYHISEAKPLTGDLKKFVDDAEHGIIYVSFGTIIKSSTLPAEQLKAVLGAMMEFPQRFIWKWEDKTLIRNKDKLYISDWLPQVDILAHPKTLAFFSHAGMGGTAEAIHFGVPMVAMPIIGDQPANAAAVEESGLGVQLQYRDLTKDNLVAAFKKVLDLKFREKAKEVSRAWHDRPLSAIDTAIFWTEYAARHSNFTFRAAAADVPLYQYINVDIAGVFCVIILLIVFICKILITVCCRSRDTISEKRKQSNKKSKRD